MEPREFYETGLVDEHATPINEGDEITVTGMMGKKWVGEVLLDKGCFIIRYDDLTEDPLSEVNHVCQVTKSYNHTNFNDALKRKIKHLETKVSHLELDLINCINNVES